MIKYLPMYFILAACTLVELFAFTPDAMAGFEKQPKKASPNTGMRPFMFTVDVQTPSVLNIPLVSKNEYDIKLSSKDKNLYKVNYDLDCDGDGVYEKVNQTGNVQCRLAAGTHTISIRGTIPGLKFDTGKLVNGYWDVDENGKRYFEEGGGFDLKKPLNVRIISIDQWGDTEWRNLSKMFPCAPADIMALNYCSNLKGGCGHAFTRTYKAKDAPNLKYVRSLSCVGGAYSAYEGDFSHWDVSEITDMSRAFMGTPENISIKMCNSCFFEINSFNQNIGEWNTSKVTNMSHMFEGNYSFNQPIGNWNTSKVIDMSSMFEHASSFNQPIGNWDTSSVKYMQSMFSLAFRFNQNISTWNISHVKNLIGMFYRADKFNQDLSSWDVSKAKTAGMLDESDEMSEENYPKGVK